MDKLMANATVDILSGDLTTYSSGKNTNGSQMDFYYEKNPKMQSSFFQFQQQMLQSLKSQNIKAEEKNLKQNKNDSFDKKPDEHRSLNWKQLKNISVQPDPCHESTKQNSTTNTSKAKELKRNNETHTSYKVQCLDTNSTQAELINALIIDLTKLDCSSTESESDTVTKHEKETDDANSMNQDTCNSNLKDQSMKKKRNRRCRKSKSKTKDTKPVYLCPKCNSTYILPQESEIQSTKCLYCDYWTPQDPEFMKDEKLVNNFCKVS